MISKTSFHYTVSLALTLAAIIVLRSVIDLIPLPSAISPAQVVESWRDALQPEPQERTWFIVMSCLIVVLPYILNVILQRWSGKNGRQCGQADNTFFYGWPGQVVLMAGIMTAIIFGAFGLLRPNYIFLPSGWLFGTATILVLAEIAVQKKFSGPGAIISGSVAGALLVYITVQSYIPEGAIFPTPYIAYHYCVLAGAVNQILHGKLVLVDTLSQYGVLYSFWAALWLKLISVSIHSLSLFFALLILLSWSCIYLVLRQVFRAPIMALITFGAVLGFSHGWNLPYYQYLPLRVVWGAAFILAVCFYSHRPRPAFFLAASFIAAGSPLWNLDTGIILLGTWLALLAFNRLVLEQGGWRQKSLRYVAECLPTVFLAILFLAVYDYYARWRSGTFVDWNGLFHFQKIYYESGFCMLPMPRWDFWILPVIIYAGTLLYVFDNLRTESGAKARFYFALSIYGIGLLAYYQGRSNITCLAVAIYPSVMLAGLLLRDISRTLGWRHFLEDGRMFRGVIAICLLLYLGLGISFLLSNLPASFHYVRNQVLAVRNLPLYAADSPEKQVEQFIGRNPDTLLLKHGGEFIYFQAHQPMPIRFSSPYEIILKKDVKSIQRDMDRGRIGHVIVHDDMQILARELSLRNFHLESRIGLYSIYRRSDGANGTKAGILSGGEGE